MKGSRDIDLQFAHLKLYEHYVVSSIQEGVSLTKDQLDELFGVFDTYYKGRPFVSIALRENDYTIDPNLLKSRKHPDLLGIAVVYVNESSKKIAEFERKFYQGKYEIFPTMKAAQAWADELLQEYIKKAGL